MQIHVVESGDTLFRIANTYSVPVEVLIEKNKISNANDLVVGQTVVIPIQGSYHFVKPGENLYKISNLYNISVDMLKNINNIQDVRYLPIGYRLFIPQKQKKIIETGAYNELSLTKENAPIIINNVGEYLTYLPSFSYQINAYGTLTMLSDEAALAEAKRRNVAPLMVITNISQGQFSTELATKILSNSQIQDKLLDEVIRIMNQKGYVGLDVDLEFLGKENKDRYVAFLKKAKVILKQENSNYSLSVALPPKTKTDQVGTLYEGHDYAQIGEVADKIFLMTYEWGWSGGPPMAVSPLDKVKDVMNFALSKIPKNKLFMGVPLYGYDWTLPYVKGGKFARSIDQIEAYNLAAKYNVAIQYDEQSQAPFFFYTDKKGNKHEVWFDDARSYQAKFDYVKELGIRGMFNWVLGFDSPQNWLLIEDNFTPVKLDNKKIS